MADPTQLDLDWARPHVRDGDPETSIAAAESMPALAGEHCRIIRQVLQDHEPLSSEEIANHCELSHAQVWRRMSDLCNDGWVVNSGTQSTNASGREAIQWQLVNGPPPHCRLCQTDLPANWPHHICHICRRDLYADERHEVEEDGDE